MISAVEAALIARVSGSFLAVGGENERDDLCLLPVALRERRAHRPVDQA